MESKKIILYLALKYNGEWSKIYADIKNKVIPSNEEIERVASAYQGGYITIIDKDYPNELKQAQKPPFVLFYQGDLNLLNRREKRLAVGCLKDATKEENDVSELMFQDYKETFVLGGKGAIDKYLMRLYANQCIVVAPTMAMAHEYKCGLIVSEVPCERQDNEIYAMRYRIMSALGDKILIFSCKAGSNINLLIQYGLYNNKDILVVPTSPLANRNNNDYIYEGATPVWSGKQLTNELEGGY